MGIYVRQMFNTTGESTTLVDLNKGTTGATGAFLPDFDGRIVQVRLQWSGEAVTSLFENVRVELNCNIWSPNTNEFGQAGPNIRTAPAFTVPDASWLMDQKVQTTQEIKGQYAYDNAATPVTAHLAVFGTFSGPG